MAIETICESMSSLISQIKNRSVVQFTSVLGKRVSTPLQEAAVACKSGSALPGDCLLSGFCVLKIIMHNASCLCQVGIFPLIGLLPPSRALWDGGHFVSRGSCPCFLRLVSTKALSGMGVFKSTNVIFVSNYNQVKILLYLLDFVG